MIKSFLNTKKPRDECAVFGVFNNKDAAALTPWDSMHYNIEDKIQQE